MQWRNCSRESRGDKNLQSAIFQLYLCCRRYERLAERVRAKGTEMQRNYAAMLGQPASADTVTELVAALGPWDVKAYPAVGKVFPMRSKSARGAFLCRACPFLRHGLSASLTHVHTRAFGLVF